MNPKLAKKVDPVREYAESCGWDCEVFPTTIDGATDATQIVGVRTDRHPDAAEGVTFGFVMAWAIRPETGRACSLILDPAPNGDGVLIVTVEDGSGRYWTSRTASHFRHALDDPEGWTGVYCPVPAEAAS